MTQRQLELQLSGRRDETRRVKREQSTVRAQVSTRAPNKLKTRVIAPYCHLLRSRYVHTVPTYLSKIAIRSVYLTYPEAWMGWVCPGRADLVEIPTGQQANAWRLWASQSCCMSGTYYVGAVR